MLIQLIACTTIQYILHVLLASKELFKQLENILLLREHCLMPSVADPDPWNPYHFQIPRIRIKKWLDQESGARSVSNDTDPDPTKTIENRK